MFLREGKFDAAIAKFAIANQKGPHFADPLEMWGEALIAKNRSDLALAKFEEANKYAPHWGRLHLKWAEALWWSGERDEARKQLAIATTLDLTQEEKSELAKVLHG
jgi:tetratricopeptide (TPR) repeat protein